MVRCRLVIAARTVDKLTETQNECLKNSPNVHTVIADVSKEEDCKAIVDKAVEVFGGVDILILNAARVPTPQWFTDFDNPVSCVLLNCGTKITLYQCLCFTIHVHIGHRILESFQVSSFIT